jgi:anti-sigma B factor antagonist
MNGEAVTYVRIPKRLDARETRAFLRELKAELNPDHPCMVVDLSQVEQMDTAGLDMLLQCMLEVSKRDGSVKLAGISPQAATVLELTRMDRIFSMFPSVPETLPSFEIQTFVPMADEAAPQPAAA